MADICPYTCIVEDCPTPDRLYVTRAEWTRHIEKDHQQCWQCLPCTTAGKAPLIFPSVETFIDHLREVHAGTIKEDQFSTLIPEATRPVPTGISCCPLCDSTGPADSPILMGHIAEHIHAFSLRSLPWPKSDAIHGGADDDESDVADDDEEVNGNYFEHNDYFDQGSNEASRQYNLTSGSDRDSEGLPSLHSSQGSTRPSSASDSVQPLSDEPPVPDTTEPPEDTEPPPIIPPVYDPARGLPVEFNPLPEAYSGPSVTEFFGFLDVLDPETRMHLASIYSSPVTQLGGGKQNWKALFDTWEAASDPYNYRDNKEVVEGDWPQLCPQRFAIEDDIDEINDIRERLLQCLRENYRRRAEYEESLPPPYIRLPPNIGDDSDMQTFYDKPLVVRARILESRDRLDEAIPLMLTAVDKLKTELGIVNWRRMEYVETLVRMFGSSNLREGCIAFLITEANDVQSYIQGDEFLQSNEEAEQGLLATRKLGSLLESCNMMERADQLYKAIINVLSASIVDYGPRHELTIQAMKQLATFFGRTNSGPQACEVLETMLEINESKFGHTDTRTLDSQTLLANMMWNTNTDKDRGLALLEGAVEELCKKLDYDAVPMDAFKSLSRVYVALGRYTAAAVVNHAMLDILRQQTDEHELEMRLCLISLDVIYLKMGDETQAVRARALADWLRAEESERKHPRPPYPSRPTGVSRSNIGFAAGAEVYEPGVNQERPARESRRSRMLRFFRGD